MARFDSTCKHCRSSTELTLLLGAALLALFLPTTGPLGPYTLQGRLLFLYLDGTEVPNCAKFAHILCTLHVPQEARALHGGCTDSTLGATAQQRHALQLRQREQHSIPACPICALGDHKLTGWVPRHALRKPGTMSNGRSTFLSTSNCGFIFKHSCHFWTAIGNFWISLTCVMALCF